MGDVIIKKIAGGIGRQVVSQDSTSGMIIQMDNILGGVQEGVAYKLGSLQDAEDLLITEAASLTQFSPAWHNIRDFFEENIGATLWIAISSSSIIDDIIGDGWQPLMQAAEGEIRQIAVIEKLIDATTLAMESRVLAAQGYADQAEAQKQPVVVLVRGFIAFPSTMNLRNLNSQNVGVVVAQDYDLVQYEDPLVPNSFPFRQQTLLGRTLGVLSRVPVNENIGWVLKNNVFGGSLTQTSLHFGGSSYPINTISDSVKDTLDDLGYIFLKTYPQKAGLYYNDSHTCTEIISDFAYLENVRTIDKASRLIYQALLPSVNSPIQVDPNTGQLAADVVKAFELTGRRALDQMFNNSEISGATVIVDPSQNILVSSILVVQFEIVPTGTARTISAEIGFTNPFNA